jgi:hypothetical protein
MAGAGEEYLINRKKQIERKQKIVTYISVVSFFGSILVGGVNAIKQVMQTPQPVVVSPENSLQQQARGYELVLQREPNNQMALERLSLLRLQLKDVKGSVELLERLVKLHPDRQDYKLLLQQMQKQDGKGDQ